MSSTELLSALEAVLIVSDQPLTAADLATGLGYQEAEISQALSELAADYAGEAGGRMRGFELREVAGGYRIFSRAEFHDAVRDFLTAGQTAKLSQAALETLAVIAYRQPVSRARIAAIRGVSVDGVIRTLLMRGLIIEAGREDITGATLFATSHMFLEAIGLNSIDELPSIAPYLPADTPAVEDSLSPVDGVDAT